MAVPLTNILFLDIETVPQQPSFELLPTEWRALWTRKAEAILRNREEEETIETIYPRAGIYAEFGKIICISCGVIQGNGNDRKLTLKSFAGDHEPDVLQSFCEMLTRWSDNEQRYLCAHNGKEFDFPYICRRLIINKMPLPVLLDIGGRKPWEVPHFDTMDLWKFGDYKNYTTLNLLAYALGIPTPKDDIDGSRVWEVYWKEKNLPRIVSYCQKDVITVAQIFLRINNYALIRPENIEIKS